MTKSEKLTNAILDSMGKKDDPIGVLIEAVLEKEFQSYNDLLKDCKKALNDDRMSIKQEMILVDKINCKLNENKSTLRSPVND